MLEVFFTLKMSLALGCSGCYNATGLLKPLRPWLSQEIVRIPYPLNYLIEIGIESLSFAAKKLGELASGRIENVLFCSRFLYHYDIWVCGAI